MHYIKSFLLWVLLPVIVVFTLLTISLNQVDEGKLYQKISTLDSSDLQSKASLYITKTFLPLPSIKITDNTIYDMYIEFDFISLLRFDPQIKSLNIKRFKGGSTQLNLKTLENLIIQLQAHQIPQITISTAEDTVMIATKKKTSQLTITNDNYKFESKLYLQDKKVAGGKSVLSLYKPSFFNDFVPTEIAHNLINLPDLDFHFKFINTDDGIIIKKLSASKLAISGNATIPHDENKIAQIHLQIPTLNLQQIVGLTQEVGKQKATKITAKSLFSNHSTFVDVSIENVSFADEIMQDARVKILSSEDENQLVITGQFASSDKFSVQAQKGHDSEAVLYKIQAYHHNINQLFESLRIPHIASGNVLPTRLGIEASSENNILDITNISLQMESSLVKGKNTIVFDNGVYKHDANLSVSNLVIDDKRKLPLISPLFDYITSLTKNVDDGDYLKKYIPLRTLNINGNFVVNCDNVRMYDMHIEQGKLNVSLVPSVVTVNLLESKGVNHSLKMSGQLNSTALTPQLAVNVINGDVSFEKESGLTEKLYSFVDTYLAKNPLDITANIYLNEMQLPSIDLRKLSSHITSRSNLISIKDLRGEIYHDDTIIGKLRTKANLEARPFKISSSFALSDCDIKTLLPLASTKNLPFKSGWANITGTASSSAHEYQDILDNAVIESTIQTVDLVVDNIALDDVIVDINNPDYNVDRLYSDLKSALAHGSTTMLKASAKFDYRNDIAHISDVSFRTKYSVGAANLAYSPAQDALSMKASLSFALTPPKRIRTAQQISRPVSYSVKGDSANGYKVDVEADGLYQYLASTRGAFNFAR